MLIDELHYELPPELIAQTPADERSDSRLMVVRRGAGSLEHRRFREIGAYLRSGDLLVVNDVRVLRARLRAHKEGSGGAVELLLVERRDAVTWEAMARPAKRLHAGTRLVLGEGDVVEVVDELPDGHRLVRFEAPGDDIRVMDAVGELPLPPYVRAPAGVDPSRYQTVYAAGGAAVAAPTAGLHFTPELLADLGAAGVGLARVTLDVGPGTFLPLRHQVVEENRLHRETFRVGAEAAAAIDGALREGRRVVAVGTTSMRVLETLGPHGFAEGAREGATEIFIRPGVPIRVASVLVTNFHLPGTSLLCLVGAVAGVDLMRRAYLEAVRERYRFYSFGDAMLIME